MELYCMNMTILLICGWQEVEWSFPNWRWCTDNPVGIQITLGVSFRYSRIRTGQPDTGYLELERQYLRLLPVFPGISGLLSTLFSIWMPYGLAAFRILAHLGYLWILLLHGVSVQMMLMLVCFRMTLQFYYLPLSD